MKKSVRRILLALLLALALCACGPESGRARGGGPGASGSNLPAGGLVPQSKVFAGQSQ